MIKRPINFVLSLIAAVGFMLPAVALSADAPPPLAEIWYVTSKAGHDAELRKAMGEHMAFRSEHGDPRTWEVYTPILGEDLNRYAIRFCCFNWADQDSYRAWQAGATEINEHYNKHVVPHTEKAARYFESIDWANSHWVEAASSYKFIAVTEFNIKPGSGQDFDAARDSMSQIALNQGWATDDHPWLWASTIGGKLQESVIIPHENFASFERGQENFMSFLSRHMGSEAAAKLGKQFSEASWSTEFQIWEQQDDLSMSKSD